VENLERIPPISGEAQDVESGDMILGLGGPHAPWYGMGYPHRFEKLELIDLPPEDRHDYYKELVQL
jgi:hypothetical protein